MKLWELEQLLQDVKPFEKPNIKLEQVPSPFFQNHTFSISLVLISQRKHSTQQHQPTTISKKKIFSIWVLELEFYQSVQSHLEQSKSTWLTCRNMVLVWLQVSK